jgi:acetyl-CoA carboxylase biotin carboxyl carrier protein
MAENKDSSAKPKADLPDNELERIRELIKIMKDNDLVEVEIKHGNDRISLKRSGPQQPVATAKMLEKTTVNQHAVEPSDTRAAEAAASQQEDLEQIKSPLVGTFYVAPSPDSEPYVQVGSAVGPQTVVCIVEAMKVLNEIKAEINGTIVEILATNGQAIEYGQVLFRVKPD